MKAFFKFHLLFVIFAVTSLPVYSDNNDPCGFMGRLFYVGKTSNNSFSIWLSKASNQTTGWTNTTFEDANGQVFDTFNLSTNRIHFSFSPVVASGALGAHSVFDNTQGKCLIDTREQIGGIIIPIPGGGGGDGSNNIVSSFVTNINQNFITAYVSRSYNISDRIVYGLFRWPRYPDGPAGWQVWVEPRYTNLNDKRYGLSANGNSKNVLTGAHYAFGSNFIFGLSIGHEDTNLNAFDGALVNNNSGTFVGPYIGIKFLKNWIVDSWFIYGHSNVKSNLDILTGRFNTNNWMSSNNLTYIFEMNSYQFRTRLSAFVGGGVFDAFDYQGIIQNAVPVSLKINKDSYAFGRTEGTIQMLKTFTVFHDKKVIPSAQFGLNYNISTPNDNKMLNSDLDYVKINPFSGLTRLGLGFEQNRNVRFDLLAGYYSLGQNGLNLWDARLAVTVSAS